MLLEIGIFDAYGAGFEYSRPNGHRQNDLRQYYSHPRFRQIPGRYTDDTEMSIMIAELLVEKLPWNPVNILLSLAFHRLWNMSLIVKEI